MDILLQVLLLGSLCILTTDQQLDHVSFHRVGKKASCPSDVVTLQCAIVGEVLEWYCVDEKSRILACPVEDILPLECDGRVYEFYDCEQNGTEITSSLYFNATIDNTTLTCRNGENTDQNETIVITLEAPSPPILVLSDQIYEDKNSYVVNISWSKAANIQYPTYEVHLKTAIKEEIFVTQECYIMLDLDARKEYIITIKIITCNGDLNSTESQSLHVELKEPPEVAWCNITGNEDRMQVTVQWNPLPVSERISNGVDIQLLYYNLTYSVMNRTNIQILQPGLCDTTCLQVINTTATNISVNGVNVIGPGRMKPCNLPDDDTINVTEDNNTLKIALPSSLCGAFLISLLVGVLFCVAHQKMRRKQPETTTSPETNEEPEKNENKDSRETTAKAIDAPDGNELQVFKKEFDVQEIDGELYEKKKTKKSGDTTSCETNGELEKTESRGPIEKSAKANDANDVCELEEPGKEFDVQKIDGTLCDSAFLPLYDVKRGAICDKPLQSSITRGIAVSAKRIAITCEEAYENNFTFYLVRVFSRESNDNEFSIVGFKTPQGIAIDEHENIYVADSDQNQIVKFHQDGRYQMQRGDGEKPANIELYRPQGLHIEGLLLYVGNRNSNWIHVFDLKLTPLYKLGAKDVDRNFLFGPLGIAYYSEDNCFYTVTRANVLTKVQISDDWKTFFVSKISPKDPVSDQQIEFTEMRRIAVYKDYILVTQHQEDTILCLTVHGELKHVIKVKNPADLTVFEDRVYVCTKSTTKSIEEFTVKNHGSSLETRSIHLLPSYRPRSNVSRRQWGSV